MVASKGAVNALKCDAAWQLCWAQKEKLMPKFLEYTSSLRCKGYGLVWKVVKVAITELVDGRVKLEVVSGLDSKRVVGCAIVSPSEYFSAPIVNVEKAKWALDKCGWTVMTDDFDCGK